MKKKNILHMIGIFLVFYFLFQGYLTTQVIPDKFKELTEEYISFGALVNTDENLNVWINNMKWQIGSDLGSEELLQAFEARKNDEIQFWTEKSSYTYSGNSFFGQNLVAKYIVVDVYDNEYEVTLKARINAPFLSPRYESIEFIDENKMQIIIDGNKGK